MAIRRIEMLHFRHALIELSAALPPGYEPVERLKKEINALRREDFPGLPKLLDFNEDERWIVTEYFPEKTLEDHPLRHKARFFRRSGLFVQLFRLWRCCISNHSLRAVTYRLRNPGPVHKLDHGQSDEKHIAIGRRVSHRLVQTTRRTTTGSGCRFCSAPHSAHK
jgi:hypothetical protein